MDTLSAVEQGLLNILKAHPQGIRELDLIHQLTGQKPDSRDKLELFRSHFLLRHQLYRLRDSLWQGQQAHLEIGPVELRLRAYTPGTQQIGQPDPLREYYLDLNNLEQTDERDVDDLLDAFWQRFLAAEDKQLALSILQLEEPVDFDRIKQRYRQLSQEHHPDKGGDAEQFQRINQAMDVLRRYYRKC